jgi:hypothetical protein
MKRVIIPFVLLVLVASFSSCKKEEGGSGYVKPKTSLDFLTEGGTWQLAEAQTKVGNGDWVNTISVIPECVRDNQLNFLTESTYTLVEGPIKCDVNGPSTIGKGRFDLIEQGIKILYTDTVITVNTPPTPNDTLITKREELYKSITADEFIFINSSTNSDGETVTTERIWRPVK